MINAGYGSSYGSYDAPASPPAIQEPASIAVNPSVPLQTAFVPQSRPVIPENSDPNPPASQWDQPPGKFLFVIRISVALKKSMVIKC